MYNNIPKIATPISHLFEDEIFGREISAVSDCLEVRERSLDSRWNNQHLFHLDIDLTHEWNDSIKAYLINASKVKPDLKLITLQATRCCQGEKLIANRFQLDGKIYSSLEMLNNSQENTNWLREILGNEVTIGLENNNYYPTPAYDIVTDGEFITQILMENNLYLLLDIAHAMVTAHNKKISYNKYLTSLPLDRLIQLHICQPELPDGETAEDAHGEPNSEMYFEVIRLVRKYASIKYLTIEYYKDKDILIDSINKLRHLLGSPNP